MLYGNSQLTVAPCVAGRATASYTPCALVGVLLAPTSEPLTTLASPQPEVLVADLEYNETALTELFRAVNLQM